MSQGDTGTSNFKQPKFTWTWLRGYMVCFSFAHGLHLPMLASPFTISSAYPLTPLQALHVGFKLGKKKNLCWTILEYNTFVLFTKFFDVLVALPVLCPRLWSCSGEWSVPDNFLAEKPA